MRYFLVRNSNILFKKKGEKFIENTIKEKWFKDHIATITKCGDITILDWKNSGTIVNDIRYIFDGYNIYISGDLGSAVFRLTWKADLHSFNNIDIHYFIEKLETFSNDK